MTEPIRLDTHATAAAWHDGAYRGKRLSWKEFYQLRPDLKPANDNKQEADDVRPTTAAA